MLISYPFGDIYATQKEHHRGDKEDPEETVRDALAKYTEASKIHQ